jgi:hypothetical protein|tara:strand:- start:220 stop:444 length:225 start_codon:yes stop_codon:yes gene_type:complete
MKERILKMLVAKATEKREKALTSLELLMDNSVGIGDHSTGDFYNNIEEAFSSLIDADDMLETLKKYDWHNMQDM